MSVTTGKEDDSEVTDTAVDVAVLVLDGVDDIVTMATDDETGTGDADIDSTFTSLFISILTSGRLFGVAGTEHVSILISGCSWLLSFLTSVLTSVLIW